MEGVGGTGTRRRRRQSANYRRRHLLSRPNYRRLSGNYRRLRSSTLYALSAFFIMTASREYRPSLIR